MQGSPALQLDSQPQPFSGISTSISAGGIFLYSIRYILSRSIPAIARGSQLSLFSGISNIFFGISWYFLVYPIYFLVYPYIFCYMFNNNVILTNILIKILHFLNHARQIVLITTFQHHCQRMLLFILSTMITESFYS